MQSDKSWLSVKRGTWFVGSSSCVCECSCRGQLWWLKLLWNCMSRYRSRICHRRHRRRHHQGRHSQHFRDDPRPFSANSSQQPRLCHVSVVLAALNYYTLDFKHTNTLKLLKKSSLSRFTTTRNFPTFKKQFISHKLNSTSIYKYRWDYTRSEYQSKSLRIVESNDGI